jgi:hypothetical protein
MTISTTRQASPWQALIPTLTNGQAFQVSAPSAQVPATPVPVDRTLASEAAELAPHVSDEKVITRSLIETIGTRPWFSDTNRGFAVSAIQGAMAAAQAGQSGYLSYFLQTLVDLYHNDRAHHAGALVKKPQPVLYKDLPVVPHGRQPYEESSFQRNITPLQRWEPGTPYRVIAPVVTLMQQEMPDSLSLITFAIRRPAPQINDPFIYAAYGPWWVRVAQWE